MSFSAELMFVVSFWGIWLNLVCKLDMTGWGNVCLLCLDTVLGIRRPTI